MTDDLARAYLDEALRALRGHKRLAEGAMAQLGDEQLFIVPDAESNSVALIVKHLTGNMRSRFTDFLISDGEKPWRNRDSEFEAPDQTREALMHRWEAGWQVVFDALQPVTPADLTRTVSVRGEPLSVLQAIHRQVAHYAYHVGQLVFWAKHLKGPEWKSLSIPKGKSQDPQVTRAAERNRP